MVPTTWKEEWKSASVKFGEQLLMTTGVDVMLKLYADNWDLLMDVCILKEHSLVYTHYGHMCFCLLDGLPYGNARFGQGVDPIAMDIVQCLGNETMLIDCPYNIPIFDYHSEDAGVRCFSDAGLVAYNVQHNPENI